MFRSVIAFSLLSLLLCSVGCRICSTPYDHCISTYIERHDDYRGCYPLYRGGSIFCGQGDCCGGGYVDYYNNAGNYGITTPITLVGHTSNTGLGTFETHPDTGHSTIGIPDSAPGKNGGTPPPIRDPKNPIPTVKELIDQPRGTTQFPVPNTPPAMPRTAPHFEDMPSPFAPSDAVPNLIVPDENRIIPPNTHPTMMETDPPITLEELRRLDPTIQDVQIISIEDVTPLK